MVGLSVGVGMGGRSLIEETELFLGEEAKEEVLEVRELRLDSNTAPAVNKDEMVMHVSMYIEVHVQ